MISDPHFIRFISYLKLFTVAMLVLVTANNYVQLFVGWEGVGLASFLLISFWFNRLQATKAAIQAMLVNRVGDLGLALGIATLYFCYKTTDYGALFCTSVCAGLGGMEQLTVWGGWSSLDIACVLLLLGAAGKSGQFGLHIWLPNAMNAPTPVSALLHAATMVNFCCQTTLRHRVNHSAICWNNLKVYFIYMIRRCRLINQVNQQETLSKLTNCNTKGSSETERRITFQLDHFIIVKPKHKLTVHMNFSTWLEVFNKQYDQPIEYIESNIESNIEPSFNNSRLDLLMRKVALQPEFNKLVNPLIFLLGKSNPSNFKTQTNLR
jgi:NADH:ubiquinone oxidoreductase subunit K